MSNYRKADNYTKTIQINLTITITTNPRLSQKTLKIPLVFNPNHPFPTAKHTQPSHSSANLIKTTHRPLNYSKLLNPKNPNHRFNY